LRRDKDGDGRPLGVEMVTEGSRVQSALPDSQGGSTAGQPRESSYEVVVIGAGIGGLTAGALLAHAGKKVLVVEAEAQPGGCARALRRGPYTFDSADHLIWGCAPEGPFGPGLIDTVLRHLGVRDRCEFVRMDEPIYEARFPGLTLAVPHGREEYLEAHLRQFPGEGAGLRRLVELSAEICREVGAFPVRPGLSDYLLTPRHFPRLFRYRNVTVKELIDRELSDPRLKAVYATLWPWIGPPPERLSFFLWGTMMAGYVEDGAYYPLGSFQRLADALAAGLIAAGGELVLGTRVARILAGRPGIRGVELAGGRRVATPMVISNIDARDTFEKLLGPEDMPARYLRRLRRMTLAHVPLAVYAATDLDVRALGAQHDTTLYTDWDSRETHAKALAGRVSTLSILIPTLKDPSLAPPGEHLVILKTSVGEAGETSAEGDLADRMLELAEGVLPDLRQHLTYVEEGAEGEAFGSRVLPLGWYGGWASTPRQVGIRRLAQQTPVSGLLLAGQWTRPGVGIWTVMWSGVAAARMVLGVSTSSPALPLQL